MKKYFMPYSDLCYPLSVIKKDMKEMGIEEIELTEAIPYKDPNYIWCGFNHEVGERGECGKFCSDYSPKNGKSGCCRHLGKLNELGNKLTIKI